MILEKVKCFEFGQHTFLIPCYYLPKEEIFLNVDEIMYAESYEPLQTLSDSNLSNNIDILKALVDQEHDQPLLDGSTKDRV